MPAFSLGAVLSMLALHAVNCFLERETGQIGLGDIFKIIFDTVVATFFLTVLVSMWVVFRGSGRQFVGSMYRLVLFVGFAITPVALISVTYLLEMIGYGTPTQALPGLEIQLGSAMLTGEALVRLSSCIDEPMLGNGG